jgi:hypothetical protein
MSDTHAMCAHCSWRREDPSRRRQQRLPEPYRRAGATMLDSVRSRLTGTVVMAAAAADLLAPIDDESVANPDGVDQPAEVEVSHDART